MVISLYILLWHVAKIVLPPIGLLHEIDFITPGNEALPAPGLGDDVTAAKCKPTCPGLSQTYGQGWGFPLENGRGPSNATAVHPVLRDHWPLPSTTVSGASDHNSGGHWMLSKLSTAPPEHTGNPDLVHLWLCLCLSEGNAPKFFQMTDMAKTYCNVADPLD